LLAAATIVAAAVFGSLMLAFGGASAPEASTSASRSGLTIVTSSPRGSMHKATPGVLPDLSMPPLPSAMPAVDDNLRLAGADGTALLHCGTAFAFDFEALRAPTGAEDRAGPEFDALREFLTTNVSNGDTTLSAQSTVRVVARDKERVAFLIDRIDRGPWGENGGPFQYVYFRGVGDSWSWAGSGDCQPRAYGFAGFAGATWTLDPGFRRPRAPDRVLHILVSQYECSSGRSASGRIGPAYVITDRYEVHIEIQVQTLPGGQDCQGVPPTPATLRLSEAIGDRTLRDTNAHIRSGTGG
jgi:hypothetical protein